MPRERGYFSYVSPASLFRFSLSDSSPFEAGEENGHLKRRETERAEGQIEKGGGKSYMAFIGFFLVTPTKGMTTKKEKALMIPCHEERPLLALTKDDDGLGSWTKR